MPRKKQQQFQQMELDFSSSYTSKPTLSKEQEALLAQEEILTIGRIMRICHVSSNQAESILLVLKERGMIAKKGKGWLKSCKKM